MIIELDPAEYGQSLEQLFQQSLSEAGIQSRSGSLYKSLKITKIIEGENERFVLSFNDYGVFLDEGVQGRLGGATGKGAGGFQFFFRKGQGLPVPAKPPYGGYGLGIKARPWVAKFLARIEDEILPQLAQDVFIDFDEYVAQNIKGIAEIQIKGKL